MNMISFSCRRACTQCATQPKVSVSITQITSITAFAAGVEAKGSRISPDQVETQVQDVTDLPTPEEPKGSVVSPNHSAHDKRATYHNKGGQNQTAEEALQSEVIPPQEPNEKKEPETHHANGRPKNTETTKESKEETEKKTKESEPTKESKKALDSKEPTADPKPHSEKTRAQACPQHMLFTDSEDEARDFFQLIDYNLYTSYICTAIATFAMVNFHGHAYMHALICCQTLN